MIDYNFISIERENGQKSHTLLNDRYYQTLGVLQEEGLRSY